MSAVISEPVVPENSLDKKTEDKKPEDKKQLLRQKIQEQQNKRKKQKKSDKGKKVVHNTDDMLKQLGYDLDIVTSVDPETGNKVTVRDELTKAIENGQVKTTAELQQWMALHAPLNSMPGIDHNLVAEMTLKAQLAAENAVAAMLEKK